MKTTAEERLREKRLEQAVRVEFLAALVPKMRELGVTDAFGVKLTPYDPLDLAGMLRRQARQDEFGQLSALTDPAPGAEHAEAFGVAEGHGAVETRVSTENPTPPEKLSFQHGTDTSVEFNVYPDGNVTVTIIDVFEKQRGLLSMQSMLSLGDLERLVAAVKRTGATMRGTPTPENLAEAQADSAMKRVASGVVGHILAFFMGGEDVGHNFLVAAKEGVVDHRLYCDKTGRNPLALGGTEFEVWTALCEWVQREMSLRAFEEQRAKDPTMGWRGGEEPPEKFTERQLETLRMQVLEARQVTKDRCALLGRERLHFLEQQDRDRS